MLTQFSPASVAEVADSAVDEFFKPLGSRELLVTVLPGFKEV